jgi:hypothetical protein
MSVLRSSTERSPVSTTLPLTERRRLLQRRRGSRLRRLLAVASWIAAILLLLWLAATGWAGLMD